MGTKTNLNTYYNLYSNFILNLYKPKLQYYKISRKWINIRLLELKSILTLFKIN